MKPNPCIIIMERVSQSTIYARFEPYNGFPESALSKRVYYGHSRRDAAYMAARYARERLGATSTRVEWLG